MTEINRSHDPKPSMGLDRYRPSLKLFKPFVRVVQSVGQGGERRVAPGSNPRQVVPAHLKIADIDYLNILKNKI